LHTPFLLRQRNLNKAGIHGYAMKRNKAVAVFLAATILAGIIWVAANQFQHHEQPASPCPEFMVIDQNGHYFLNRSLVTPENADAINLCLRQAGINNVHIAKNFSELMPPDVSS
jgi:hypothetical protein